MQPTALSRLCRFFAPGLLLVVLVLVPLCNAVADDPSQPVQPGWDQLMNGSLDGRMVEIRGVIENLLNQKNGWSRVDFRTRDGVIKIEMRRAGIDPGPLEQYDNAVIRFRGKLTVDRASSARVKSGQIRMHDVEVFVDQPAPPDLFAIPSRKVVTLVQSDVNYDPFRQIKVTGQIVFVRGYDHFLMDGPDGLRFATKQLTDLQPGDLVEVVGFPEVLTASAPVLRGAVVRKTGHADLPLPKKISADDLIRPTLDSTRVVVDAILASIRQTPTNLVLEMQAGSWRFLARLTANDTALPPLQIGSKLELTGVYCAQGGYKALGEDVAAVDLLLNSPADIKILVRPSWWTLQRLVFAVGILGFVLFVAILWITQLHRKVEERSVALEAQIHERQRAEQQSALEQERARIAQDLHDQLGSDITEISMLAARAKSNGGTRMDHLDQLGEKSRRMIAALDEIVWAMNPAHDSLESLISYFCLYAERFMGLANINWRLDEVPVAVNHVVDTHKRHQLFLAFKEALTNIVRHSGATEVRLNIHQENEELSFIIADNGRGLPEEDERTQEMSGVNNMRARIEKLGGRFEMAGAAGCGTTLKFFVPYANNNNHDNHSHS